MSIWTPPQINALKTNDARTLQQIFFSLSQELGKMGKEIEQLKIDVSKNDRQQIIFLRQVFACRIRISRKGMVLSEVEQPAPYSGGGKEYFERRLQCAYGFQP